MNNKLKKTINQLAPAVFTSLIATTLGLLSLFKSNVPMIQDFGMMLAIGISVAFVLALLVLLPILVTREKLMPVTQTKQKQKKSIYIRIMYPIARFFFKMKYVVLIISVLAAGVGFYVDQAVGVETDFETFMPQDSDALSDIQELRSLVGSTDRIILLYSSDDVLSYSTLNDVAVVTKTVQDNYGEETDTIASIPKLLSQVSNNSWDEDSHEAYLNSLPSDQLRLLTDTDTNQGVINIALKEMEDEDFRLFISDLESMINDLNLSIDIRITGQSIVDQAMLDAMTSDRLSMTLIGIGLVFAALLMLYRNLFKALVIVIPIVFIVGWSGGLMYLFGFDYTPLTSTLGALIIGIGTEFTILILMRFYDFKNAGYSHQTSIEHSVSVMSKPIIVSAVTTMGGFSALIFSDFEILSNFGIMTVVNLSLALISALFVLPALLAVMGQQAKTLSSD